MDKQTNNKINTEVKEVTEKSIKVLDTSEVCKVKDKEEAISLLCNIYRQSDVCLRETLEFVEINGFTIIEIVEIFAKLKKDIDGDSCIVFDCYNKEVERF